MRRGRRREKRLRFKRKYLMMIDSGEKTLEARIDYDSLKGIRAGQEVVFFWEDVEVRVRITAIRTYKTVHAMLEAESTDALVPGATRQQALREYRRIYSDVKVARFGGMRVFAFEKLG